MGEVTVNGLPLEQHVEGELAREISEVREQENRFHLRAPITTKHTRNLSGERSGCVRIAYMPDARTTHIIIAGQQFDPLAKSPYVPSGLSALGALEHDACTDTVKCHGCGNWFAQISGPHVRAAHGMSMADFKAAHGFAQRSSLCRPSTIEKHKLSRPPRTAQHPGQAARARVALGQRRGLGYGAARHGGWHEVANLHALCREQLRARIVKLAEQLGRTPTSKELEGHGIARTMLRRKFGMSVKHVLIAAGLTPRRQGVSLRRAGAMDRI